MASPIKKSIRLRLPEEPLRDCLNAVKGQSPNCYLSAQQGLGFAVHSSLVANGIPKIPLRERIHLDVPRSFLRPIVDLLYGGTIEVTPETSLKWVAAMETLQIDVWSQLLMDWMGAFHQEHKQLQIQANAILLDLIHAESQHLQQMLRTSEIRPCIAVKPGRPAEFYPHLKRGIPEGYARFVLLDQEDRPVYLNEYPIDSEYSVVAPPTESPDKEFLLKHKIHH